MKTAPLRSLCLALALVSSVATPALAADPSSDPDGLPIRNVTVDQRGDAASGASHIERPRFAAPRHYRVMEAAPAAPRPTPTPTPMPAGHR